MENETVKMDVLIHKASLSLMSNESISAFTQKLNREARKHIFQKLNIIKGDGWLVEAYSDKVVFAVYKDNNEPTNYYAFEYSRNKDGKFEFGKSYEVERVTSYKPKSNLISKNESVTEKRNIEKNIPLEFGCWRETEKNLWTGIL